MKLCSYTSFWALFSTVDVDFRFFAYIKIFEIAKFVYLPHIVLMQFYPFVQFRQKHKSSKRHSLAAISK